MKKKVLIIGIDGGSWNILKYAIDKGYMPYLKGLVESGCSGTLLSTNPPKTPAAWGSFQTGVSPGGNGVYDFSKWDRKTKRKTLVNSRALKNTLWEIAGRSGKRIGIVNVPMTYPARDINGYMITGMFTPSVESEFTYPLSIKSELLNAIPDYHIFNLGNIRDGSPHKDLKSFVKKMCDIVDSRAEAAKYIINKEPLDMFMVHFQASDVIQHVLWGYMDKQHFLYDREKQKYIFNHFYRKLDERIKDIQESFDKDRSMTIIISDHGFQSHLKRFNLGNWLVKEGFLKILQEESCKISFKNIIKKMDFLNLGNFLRKGIVNNNLFKVLKSKEDIFNWSESSAFSTSKSDDGFIFLLGNDDMSRKRTESELIEKLYKIKDCENGINIVDRIYTREEIYKGEHIDSMPDLVVKPARGYSFTGNYIRYESNLFHIVNPKDDFHVGTHSMDGILITAGDYIKNGVIVKNASLIDIAPTILYYLGIAAPSCMEGRVLKEIFNASIPVEYSDYNVSEKENTDGKAYSNEEVQKIENRLKSLGYL